MSRPLILLVDDDPAILRITQTFLEDVDCDIATASDGQMALDRVAENPPDLVLLDYQMPRMDGLTVCKKLKSDPRTRLIPVVIVTAAQDTGHRVLALEAGADDFLGKPVEIAELQARVRSLIRLKRVYDRLDDTEQVIFALARAVEAKDSYTEAHTERVARSARALGSVMDLNDDDLDDLYRGGMVHDIGKIGIPDRVLLKQGRLTPDEWLLMQQHTIIGEEIARPLKSAQSLLAIIRHHHENVDGSGYPDGLKGDVIPVLARIVAICDGFDAMTSDRPYRPGMARETAIGILRDGAGKQWDASVVGLFVEHVAAANHLPLVNGYTSRRWPDDSLAEVE